MPARIKRRGFMAGQITVPDDFDRMGEAEIEQLFGAPQPSDAPHPSDAGYHSDAGP